MPVLLGLLAFILSSLAARIYRRRTGIWVPGWIGGISLLVIFALFFVIAIAAGAPAWLETAFFVVVGVHVGAFISLSRLKLEGAWWEVWR